MPLTIRRRCFLCFREYNGARICFDGRSQTNPLVSTNRVQLIIYLTEHHRVQAVDVGNEDRWRQHEEQEVAEQKIRAPER